MIANFLLQNKEKKKVWSFSAHFWPNASFMRLNNSISHNDSNNNNNNDNNNDNNNKFTSCNDIETPIYIVLL